MAPYLRDVFRGSIERRVLAGEERAIDLELRAARRALAAARMHGDDLDLVLITSFYPDQLHVGNGIFLAEALGLRCPCWNLESACGSALADLLLASAMIESGRARNVLVVVSCAYSRTFEQTHPMSWTSGDAAAAILLTAGSEAQLLGAQVVGTPETLGSFRPQEKRDPVVGITPSFVATREAAALLSVSTSRNLTACADAALTASGLGRADLDFAVFPTPTAWFAEFGCRALGLGREQTIDTYPRFTNTGPVLSPQNLYFAAREGRLRSGDVVLFVAQGSLSSCGSLVLRWGNPAIAPECDA
jgi:3-oxoacyl-[acyl-carrier-protein] synthase-3